MEYMSCPEAAEKWGISERRVQILCKENRIPGVSKIGYMWLIHENCYRLILMTGSKLDSTLNFYRKAGYDDKEKTGFIQYLD